MKSVTKTLSVAIPLLLTISVGVKAADSQAVANVQALLKAPSHQAELIQDKSRLPVEMVKFLDITPGMTVMDMGAGAGYSTEILAAAVGDSGIVYSQNTHFMETMAGGKYIKQLHERIKAGNLTNVEPVIWEMDKIPLKNQLDLVFWGNNIHDVYNNVGEQGTLSVLKNVYDALKPGATFAVVDHIGSADNDNKKLHRIEPAIIQNLLAQAGFKPLKTSDMYHNPLDTHQLSVFNERIFGHTDRYFIKVQKP